MIQPTNINVTNPVVILGVALVMAVTFAIGATGWTEGLTIIAFVGVGTTLISLLLIRTMLISVIIHLMSFIIGIAWSFWVTSRLLPINYEWLDRWHNLVGRLLYWFQQARQGGTSYDNLMFIFQMSLIIWGMGYMTLFLLLRSRRVWLAIIPGGVVLLINLYYAPKDISGWFLVYVMLSMILVIQFNLSQHEARWRAEGTFFRPDIRFDVLRDGFIFAVLVLAFAWLTPPVVDAKSIRVFDGFQGSWQDIQKEWNRLYADLNYRNVGTMDTFGTVMTLGGPRNLTNDPVMDVKIQGIGRYWRATTYDEYSLNGWRSTTNDSSSFGPGVALSLPTYDARTLVTQTYTLYRDNATVLYSMSNPIKVDRSARVDFNAIPFNQAAERTTPPIWETQASPWVEEITYIRSDSIVNSGDSYQVVSLATNASINQLQNSGIDYPNWVTERYLQLPNTVTERTRQLARDITTDYEDTFSKAKAIELFLRQALTYNEQIEKPPNGLDKVDYILFETQEAYCDYYASSMIVMLRSLGIPARFAVGFAQGRFDSTKSAFHVTNADAHSWVEVYFPRYGWIEFEPTSAQPIIIRPTANENEGPSAVSNPLEGLPETLNEGSGPERIPIDDEVVHGNVEELPYFQFGLPWGGQPITVSQTVVTGGGMTMVIIIITLLGITAFIWKRQSAYKVEPIMETYKRLLNLSAWINHPIRANHTPYEHTAHLKQQLPTYQTELDTITTEYVQQAFRDSTTASNTAGSVSSLESSLAWQRLRPIMLKLAIKQRLPNWLR